MKKLEIVMNAERLESLKEVLGENHDSGILIHHIAGCGRQTGISRNNRSTHFAASTGSKLRVETVMEDEVYDRVIDAIAERINTGRYRDGKVFVSEIADAV